MASPSYQFNVAQAYGASLERTAELPALVQASGETVSRGELNSLANRISAVLSASGLQRREVVGIVHTKTDECYGTMLACLKLGAIYVNLDNQNPTARLRHIFEAARPRIVVGAGVPPAVCVAAVAVGAKIIDFSDPCVAEAIAGASPGDPIDVEMTTGADPAYIMFTSGSTGVPKGALMSHGNVLNFAAWVKQRFAIVATDVFTNVNPMYFDNSVFDFYGALLNGAALSPVTREVVADPMAMLEQLERSGCTIWFSVPSMLIFLTTLKLLSRQRLQGIRTFAFGGEGYPKPELRKLFDLYGLHGQLVNVYGPTECTCICSAWDISEADFIEMQGLVTLGPMAENFSTAVLKEDDTAVGSGGIGELCLLGPQVGLGYVNDPERTAQAFTKNPLNARWEERMYRTGDLVRASTDGRKFDFVGRKDNQIKHLGYRIELEEIEAALHQLEGVSQAAVLHVAGRRAMKVLVAYVASEVEYTENRIRERLAQLLPPYMIPQRFEYRAFLPKNANGKVDRRALADL